MRNAGRSIMRESHWLPALAALAVLVPAEAHATSKTENDRTIPAVGTTCRPGAPVSFAQAILGGAPSALDAIRASQSDNSQSPVRQEAALQTFVPARIGAMRRPLEPASRVVADAAVPAPEGASPCRSGVQAIKSAARFAAPDFGALAAELDPDAELGTQPIAVQRTRFDDRWNRVRQAPPASLMHAQLARAEVHSGLGERDKLQRVNAFVNAQIAYVADDRNYGQRDLWATAGQTIARGKGDCEDFAILKMHMLRAAGVDPKRMKLVLLRDLAANADHAFLLVDTAEGKLVLDNLTDRLYDGHRAQAVRPVLSFSENRRWVHAYRGVEPAQDLIARPAARRTFAVAINNQRSVSADPLTFKTGLSK